MLGATHQALPASACLAALAPDVMVPSCLPSLPERPDPRDSPLGQLFLPKLGQPMGAGVRSRATNEQGAPDTGSALSIWSSQCRGSGGRQRGAHKGLRGPQWMGRRDFIPWGQKKCFSRGQRGAHKGLRPGGKQWKRGLHLIPSYQKKWFARLLPSQRGPIRRNIYEQK